jgi:hypothetical protein
MAVLMLPDQAPVAVVPANGRTFQLAELQAAVGGYIEAIYLPSGLIMFINEDGKRLDLAPNWRATDLARAAGIAPWDVVVGSAIVCNRTEAGADDDGDPDDPDGP